MDPGFDFHTTLRRLLEQIPNNQITTPRYLALALGDPVAERAVKEALDGKELEDLASKVTEKADPRERMFTAFDSDEPLRRLAEDQKTMAERIILEDPPGDFHSVAGVDAAYSGYEAYAVCVVMNSKINVTESRSSITSAPFPYIPGYLAFREAPAILSATRKASGFDVLLLNGHGVAHPRGCGLATFVGLELDMPTIGVAKRMLVGDVEVEGERWAPIVFEGGVVGAEIRDLGKAPVYVSTGHRMSLESSVEIVRGLLVEGSLPEPLRLAHVKSEEERRRARL